MVSFVMLHAMEEHIQVEAHKIVANYNVRVGVVDSDEKAVQKSSLRRQFDDPPLTPFDSRIESWRERACLWLSNQSFFGNQFPVVFHSVIQAD